MRTAIILATVLLVAGGCQIDYQAWNSLLAPLEQPPHPEMVYLFFGTNDDDAVAIIVAPDCPGKYSVVVTYNGEQRQDPFSWPGEHAEAEALDQKFMVENVDLTVVLERIRGVVEGVDDEFLPVIINYPPDAANLGAALKGLAEELGAKSCPACGHELGAVVIRELPFDEC